MSQTYDVLREQEVPTTPFWKQMVFIIITALIVSGLVVFAVKTIGDAMLEVHLSVVNCDNPLYQDYRNQCVLGSDIELQEVSKPWDLSDVLN